MIDEVLLPSTKEERAALPPVRRRGPKTSARGLLGLALVGGVTTVALLLGRAMKTRTTTLWYRTLRKPSWTPPDAAFGVVWPVLYAFSGLSAWRVWRAPPSRRRSVALGLWGAHMMTNSAWTPLFFGQKEPALALLDILGNLTSAAAFARVAGKIDKGAARMMGPYLAWVGFASTINASIVGHNTNGPFARLGLPG
jgi:tryptophan-rich sensory protein